MFNLYLCLRHQLSRVPWFCWSRPRLLGKQTSSQQNFSCLFRQVYNICQHWLFNRWPSLSTGRWALTQNEGEAMNITTTPTQDIIVSLRSTILSQNWQKHSLFVSRQANQPTAGRQQLVRSDPGVHGLVGQHDRRVGQRHRPQAHHLPDGERCQYALLV